MDAFYASVEQRDQPRLQGKPVVVGGRPDSRGVVASASYEARGFGVKSAMSCSQAKRLCPQAVFIYPRFDAYTEASDRIREIFLQVTPRVEPLSLDEAYLDVTENLLNEPSATRIAKWIKEKIKAETGLTASAGVAPNKFVAKIASDLKKPDGLVVISPEQVIDFVAKLPIEKLWGVGPATATRLHRLGLRTVLDIRHTSKDLLHAELGKFGDFLQALSRGVDDREVEAEWDPKSRGSENTFDKDTTDFEILRATLNEQAEEICEWLKRTDHLARTITIKVRYADFKTITRSRTLYFPSDRARILEEVAAQLLAHGTEAGEKPVRLIGLSASGFLHRDDPHQLWFDFNESV